VNTCEVKGKGPGQASAQDGTPPHEDVAPFIDKLDVQTTVATCRCRSQPERICKHFALPKYHSCSLSSNHVSCPVDRYARVMRHDTLQRSLLRVDPILTVTIVMSNQVVPPDPTDA
jgi:hypothetical protein